MTERERMVVLVAVLGMVGAVTTKSADLVLWTMIICLCVWGC